MRWRRTRPAGFPPFRRPRPVRAVHPRLVHANRLLEEGDYLQAAQLYEELGRQELDLGKVRAPYLFLQAGQARLLGGDKDAGIALIQQGLGMFEAEGRWRKLQRAGSRVLAGLRGSGYDDEAVKIEQWLQKTLQPQGEFSAMPVSSSSEEERHPLLPTTCPACGASLYPQEVDWVDALTAECNYCGNLIRGDEA